MKAAGRRAPARRRYVALLRGINVGGNNIVRMADLRAALEAAGFADVATYIQSGNVVFSAEKTATGELARRVDAALAEAFGYAARSHVLSREDFAGVVGGKPAGFGDNPGEYRYDVLFCRPPLVPAEALKSIVPRAGVDEISAGRHVLYFARLMAQATRSTIRNIIAMPMYQDMTIRNWATTTRLKAMLDE